MKVEEVLAKAGDSLTAKRVYAEPWEKDGLTVIAAAAVSGAGGGGGGTDEKGEGGSGVGFGVGAKPVGAFVIENGQLRWRPAVDVNRVIAVVGWVAAVALIVVGSRLARSPKR
ncbi:sporulation protein [Nocardia takedensis]|uniref:sporulation protein n=1 Tax=Nocardia takedensis TaxID=259390 RepID=UPI0002FC0F3A|nr:sporulation protein [Nocardia takedensis]